MYLACFSLQAQVAACRSQLSSETESKQKPAYRQAQQLEELRNLQDRLTQEKEVWAREREEQEKDLNERKSDLQRLQVTILFIHCFLVSKFNSISSDLSTYHSLFLPFLRTKCDQSRLMFGSNGSSFSES